MANELVQNGDFDGLPVGTAPDDGQPAGAWHFARENIDTGSSEGTFTGVFTIDGASAVVPGQAGNVLDVSGSGPFNMHLSNLLETEVTGDFVTRFDTYIPSGGGGGVVYVSEDADGAGSLPSERGPQIGFFKDGTVRGRSSSAIIGSYEFDKWLTFEVHSDVTNQTFDVFSSTAGELPALLGSDFEFRGNQQSFDRLSVAHFSVLSPVAQYFDNFSVQAVPEPKSGVLGFVLAAALVVGRRRKQSIWF